MFLINAGKAVSAPSEQTVLFDATAPSVTTSGTSGPGVITFLGASNNTPNVGSGPNGTSNRCLIFPIVNAQGTGAPGIISVVWDLTGANQSMTLLASTTSIYLYYLINPALGAKNLTITFSAAIAAGFTAIGASFVNVDQTGGVTTFPLSNTNTGSGTGTPTVSIGPTLSTRKIIGGFASGQANFTGPVNGIDINHQSTSNLDSGSSYDNGSATSMAYTGAGSAAWEAVAAAIKGA